MQNVAQQRSATDNHHPGRVAAQEQTAQRPGAVGTSSAQSTAPHSASSSPAKSNETDTYSEQRRRFMSDSSESDEDSVSEVRSPPAFVHETDLASHRGAIPSGAVFDTHPPDARLFFVIAPCRADSIPSFLATSQSQSSDCRTFYLRLD